MILRMTEIRGRILAAEIQGSRRDSRQDFGLGDLEILAKFWPPRFLEISAGFWPPRFRNLGEISSGFWPPRFLESRQDFGRRDLEISAGFWPPRFVEVSAGFWPPRFLNLGEISPRSKNLGGQNPAILYGQGKSHLLNF